MVWKAISDMVKRFDAVLSGCGECRGVFRIIDQDGEPLSGVKVFYKVGASEWIPCGHSSGPPMGTSNFTQLSTIYYHVGQPVTWRFNKAGFEEVFVVRYTAGKAFDEKLSTVVMSACKTAVLDG